MDPAARAGRRAELGDEPTKRRSGETAIYALEPGRHAYLVASKGAVEVNGLGLDERDGAAISGESAIRVTARGDAELILVDSN